MQFSQHPYAIAVQGVSLAFNVSENSNLMRCVQV